MPKCNSIYKRWCYNVHPIYWKGHKHRVCILGNSDSQSPDFFEYIHRKQKLIGSFSILVQNNRSTIVVSTKMAHKHNVDLSESQRKTWNSFSGQEHKKWPTPENARGPATRWQMIGCQDHSKTRWSSYGARKLPQAPRGIVRAMVLESREQRGGHYRIFCFMERG